MTAASETAIIVVAAGSGTRLAAGAPKAFVDLDGRSILRHALSAVVATKPRQVVVVVPAGFEESARTDLELVSARAGPRATVVVGGATRQLSVAAGLAVVEEGVATVLVHDAARALTPSEVISAVQAAVTSDVGVVPVLPVVDTLKRVRADIVVGAVDRDTLAAAQTPQGFPRVLLDDAYARAAASGSDYTDDAALFAAAGQSVRTIPGSPRAFKITTPADLRRARSELAESAAPDAGPRSTHPFGPPRIGIGTDVHAFADSGPLWLAGLCWPEDRALAGHSDGDVVAHAMVDALLAAAGAGDIGEHFGTGQPQFADAHAAVFLARTREIVLAAGFEIGNVSVQFQGPRPLFRPRRAEAEQALSAALGGAAVSVSATTTDGLGFPGRGEGIAATAVALVHPRRLVR